MSIIVVVRKHDKAVIAADTMQSDDSLQLRAPYVRNHEKIVRFNDTLVGLAGWAAAQDIFESVVRHHTDKLDFGSRAAIFETARNLHKLMKDDYHIDTQEEKDQPVESSQLAMLIANPGGIFEIDSYRTVSEYARFWALGSGRNLALGAMFSAYDQTDDAAAIARRGVEAACEFDDGCGMPMNLYEVPLG
ncbi:MAG: MFS transporter [Gammaproteobacteria bacterium]|nr:MFS transporter [Gammaproteobacteria bacterium]